MADTANFYADLEPVGSFGDVVAFDRYAPLPDDWTILVGDIESSTEAIRDGNYKAVNMMGAAVITSVLNACDDTVLPFVFGGDGGTIAVPPSQLKAAQQALAQLQAVSSRWFKLRLRAGSVPVAALRAGGNDVRIMKLRLSAGNDLAMFCGGGLQYCDDWIKSAAPDHPVLIQPATDEALPPLHGLSCRWQPLNSVNGLVATLLIEGSDPSPAGEKELFSRVTSGLSSILGAQLSTAAPVNDETLKFKWPPAGLTLEAQATANGKSLFWRSIEILTQSFFQYLAEMSQRKIGHYDPPQYHAELASNTDFQKYDGMLRLVLDVTEEQSRRIEEYLQIEHVTGKLNYGLHTSQAALMTCVVFSLEESRHIHFVDGSNGGYALAAVDLKRRREEQTAFAQLT